MCNNASVGVLLSVQVKPARCVLSPFIIGLASHVALLSLHHRHHLTHSRRYTHRKLARTTVPQFCPTFCWSLFSIRWLSHFLLVYILYAMAFPLFVGVYSFRWLSHFLLVDILFPMAFPLSVGGYSLGCLSHFLLAYILYPMAFPLFVGVYSLSDGFTHFHTLILTLTHTQPHTLTQTLTQSRTPGVVALAVFVRVCVRVYVCVCFIQHCRRQR